MRQKLVQKHDKKIKLKLDLFEQSIKSEQTKKVYLHYFKTYMGDLVWSPDRIGFFHDWFKGPSSAPLVVCI